MKLVVSDTEHFVGVEDDMPLLWVYYAIATLNVAAALILFVVLRKSATVEAVANVS